MWFSPFRPLEELSRNDMSHVVTNQYGNSNNFYFYVVADYSRLPPFKINWLKRTLNLGFTFLFFEKDKISFSDKLA